MLIFTLIGNFTTAGSDFLQQQDTKLFLIKG